MLKERGYKRIQLYIGVFCLIGLSLMSGCKKEDEEVDVIPYYNVVDDTIGTSAIGETAEECVLAFVDALRNEDYERAWYYFSINDNDLLTYDAFVSYFSDDGYLDITDNHSLYELTVTGNSVTLRYGVKTGEALAELSKKEQKKGVEPEYYGDYISQELIFNLGIIQDEQGLYKVVIPDSQISNVTVALKVLQGVRVYVQGVLLNERLKDNNDFYIITGFLNTGDLKVTLESDVETRIVTLPLSDPQPSYMYDEAGNLMVDAEGNPIVDTSKESGGSSIGEYAVEYPDDTKDYKAFDCVEWLSDRQTNEDAAVWFKDAYQILLNSYEKQQFSIYDSDFAKIISENGNIEELKPKYTMGIENFVNKAFVKSFTDFESISIDLVTEDILEKKELKNEMIDGHTLKVYVDAYVSFYRNELDGKTGAVISKSLKTRTIECVPIYLSQDNGYWRIVTLDKKLFNLE